MKINIICQYYYPEIGAPQARLFETAREWMRQGHEVTVLTGFPNHPVGVLPEQYRGRLFMEEWIDGVRVWRHWLFTTQNKGFLKKILSHLSFMVSVVLLSLFRGKKPDVLIVSSPTFFSVISTFIISRLRRVPYVFEVRDLWPGIFIELGVLKNKVLIRVLENIELFLYRQAAVVVPVTNGFADNIVNRGVPQDKVSVITNGVDKEAYCSGRENSDLREQINIEKERFVISYIGAHGISHGLPAILDAAEQVQQEQEILFLFVGEGAVKSDLIKLAENKGLQNVRFIPGQPKEKIIDFYQLSDVCFVPLKDIQGFDTFIPSKMFEIMACEKPIIASLRGEAADILKQSGGALVIPPEDVKALVESIRFLKENPGQRQIMGRNGRIFVHKNYDRRKLALQYLTVLEKIRGQKTENRKNFLAPKKFSGKSK